MILIRNRNELHGHLMNQIIMLKAQQKHETTAREISYVAGMIRGLEFAVEAIQEWEDIESGADDLEEKED